MTDSPATTVSDAPAPVATTQDRAASAPLDTRRLEQVEVGVAALGTLLAVYLHWFFFQNVGGLWRDEANSVSIATLPSPGQTWNNLQFDSFPILFLSLLRGWAAVFGADNDLALRALGLLIGVGIVGALWLNARVFGVRWPLFSLVLLGCNPMFVRYGDSMRAHGLGIVLILLTLAAVWRMVASPRPGRVLLAAFLAILSVQANYYNAILLLVIGVAGAVVAARERRWRAAACSLGVGVPAALSLGIYAETIRRVNEWNFLIKRPVTLAWLWRRLGEVTGAPDTLGIWVWSALFLAALGVAGTSLWRHRNLAAGPSASHDEPPGRAILFSAVVLVMLTVCYPVFLLSVHYLTEPWYYISYVALVAVGLDVIFGRVLAVQGSLPGRIARLAIVGGMAALTFVPARADLYARQTNVDLLAGQLNKLAAAGDLIVFNRWECAITFARYYHGPAPLTTLPPLTGHDFHRYDEIKAQMMTSDPVAPVLAQMEAALRGGHRVWLAGELVAPAEGEKPPAPAPLRMENGRPVGGGNYYEAWAEQAGYLLQQHATDIIDVPVPDEQPVVRYEQLRVTGLQGWH